MQVRVRLGYERGRVLTKVQMDAMGHYQGELDFGPKPDTALRRSVYTASLRTTLDGPYTPVLPNLFDATVVDIRKDELLIRGNEVIDQVSYVQSWRVTLC